MLLITDACHSGKFIGTSRAANNLINNLKSNINENTYTLTSCDKDEMSYESKKWGDGHGVFTYYFLLGLKGLADINNDDVILFKELENFVFDMVWKETNQKQSPVGEGYAKCKIIPVVQKQKKIAQKQFAKDLKNADNLLSDREIKNRGFSDDEYFYNVPDSLENMLECFNNCIGKQIFFKEDNKAKKKITTGNLGIISTKSVDALKKNAFATAVDIKGENIAIAGEQNYIHIYDANTLELKNKLTQVSEKFESIIQKPKNQ